MQTSTSSTLVYDVREVAQLLGISQTSVRGAIRRKELHAVFVGRRLLIPRTALDKLLEGPPLSAS